MDLEINKRCIGDVISFGTVIIKYRKGELFVREEKRKKKKLGGDVEFSVFCN